MIAVVDNNTMAVIGLRGLLQSIMPNAQVDTYGSFAELSANHPDDYYHYFVSVNIALANLDFFSKLKRKTIIMCSSVSPNSSLLGFRTLFVDLPEKYIIRSLLAMEQYAHSHGKGLPADFNKKGMMPNIHADKLLSDREAEVLILVVKGLINKEIAERLNIGLSTVITHRRNITEKLQRKSVGALTIYAVTHGYVSVEDI